MPTNTSRPVKADVVEGADIDFVLPVASITTSADGRPSVRASSPRAVSGDGHRDRAATPIVSRQKSSRCWFMSRTMIVAPVSLTNSMTDRPIGPAPMTRTFSPGCGRAAVDGVAADGQRLDQGELLERQLRRQVQLAGRDDELRPQAAVGVDAEDLQVLAAVRRPRRQAKHCLAVDVRLDRAAVAGLDVGHAGADRDDFDAQLVAGNARVAEERHLAEIAADVGAADADAMDADEGFAAAGGRGSGMAMVRNRPGCSSWMACMLTHRTGRRCFSDPSPTRKARDRIALAWQFEVAFFTAEHSTAGFSPVHGAFRERVGPPFTAGRTGQQDGFEPRSRASRGSA